MNPETTNRVFEDTNYLERKVVFRGSGALTFSYDAAIGLYAGTISDTRNVFSYSNNNFSYDCYVVYNDGVRNRILENNYIDINTSTSRPIRSISSQVYETTDSGNSFLTFYGAMVLEADPGSTAYTFYYILYSSRYLDTAL